MKTILLTVAALALVAACQGGSGSTTADFCYKADDCNELDGNSVEECIAYYDRCTGDLTGPQRQDWENQIQDCVELNSCDLFVNCYWEVPWC